MRFAHAAALARWTRSVGLVLIQRRDGGPALRRQWVDVPCLLCALFAL